MNENRTCWDCEYISKDKEGTAYLCLYHDMYVEREDEECDELDQKRIEAENE